jgi:MinD superfamily P-loop ATPase
MGFFNWKNKRVKELVVISGKGGTGKTSLAASFAVMSRQPVIADCDVDAADLHLILYGEVNEKHTFRSGHKAVISQNKCSSCGICMSHCRFEAVRKLAANGKARYEIDPLACEGCGVCVHFCAQKAIEFPENHCGEWMVSETRCGPMVHARLAAVAENSGKLVSLVRRKAQDVAKSRRRSLIIVDGPPGIGCPVIASLTGASQVLVVTEPTVSGKHDLERVLSLVQHFNIPAAVCVNKWDINPELTAVIEESARLSGASIAGRIRYDPGITQAQMNMQAVVETQSPCVADIQKIWKHLELEEN